MKNPIFIISASRSGSTAMAKILGTATNAKSFSEPEPKLCIEQRLFYQFGEDAIDIKSIINLKKEKIDKVIDNNFIYIDKNPNYILFFPFFEKYLDAKFIVLFRDGKDVVRSFMDWTEIMGKKLYMTHEDSDKYSYVTPCDNHWDYSFFRPQKGHDLYDKWKELTAFEKFSWYWSEANRLILDNLSKIDNKNYKSVNVDTMDSSTIKEIFDYCSLDGFDADNIDSMLNSKINSVEDRINKTRKFPHQSEWDNKLNEGFLKYTDDISSKIGEVL